MKPYR